MIWEKYEFVPDRPIDVGAYIGRAYGTALPAKWNPRDKRWQPDYTPYGTRYASWADRLAELKGQP